jgi:hypothetical protein
MADLGDTWVELTGAVGSSPPAAPGDGKVRYANGIWFLLSQNNFCYTSPDRLTWTSRSIPGAAGNELFDVAFNGSVYCIAGGEYTSATSIIATSPDLVSWTPQTPSETGHEWTGVAWNGATFIAVGRRISDNSGSIMSSADGITWTTRRGPSAFDSWQRVVWTGTVFVAASGSTVYTSPTGVTWTHRTPAMPDFSKWLTVVGSSLLLAVTLNSDDLVATSTDDGVSWTDQSATAPANGSFKGCAWNGNVFVLVADLGGEVWTSPDGVTWTQATIPAPTNSWEGGLAAGGGHFLIADSSDDILLYSVDSGPAIVPVFWTNFVGTFEIP